MNNGEGWKTAFRKEDKSLISPDSGVSIIFYIFSRFIRVETMKTKYAKDTLQAFKKKDFVKKNFGLIEEQNMV